MRKAVWFLGLVLFLSACAPITSMQPAAPAKGFGGGVALSAVLAVPRGDGSAPPVLPYAEVHWGDGQREFGLAYQIAVGGVYYKERVAEDLSLRVMVGLPGPWYEGGVFYDYEDWTFAARYSGGYFAFGDDPEPRWIWLGVASATYWMDAVGLEAALLWGEQGVLPVFGVGVRF